MDAEDWSLLIDRIALGKCTPFLGAGASWPTIETGKELAKEWAKAHKYPLKDREDLSRVTQFMGVKDPVRPKEEIIKHLATKGEPDFSNPNEPHAVLAKLPLPIYITTNYDHFMVRALAAANKEPHQEICRWNTHPNVLNAPGRLKDDPDYEPSEYHPLVFHLHGHLGITESLVLTEDDYLDYLVAISERKDVLLPEVVRGAFAGTSLLFIGYSLADWDFRVLHRGLVVRSDPSMRRVSVTVQLPYKERSARRIQEYLNQYFSRMSASVYWGSATDFAAELRQRWEDHEAAAA
jgi:hypothetical protein